MAKKGQKMAVFWPSWAEFCENKKNRLSKKVFKSKNCKNGQKRAKNGRFLALQGRIFRKSKKGSDILLLSPQRGCIPNFRKFGSSDLEKMRYKRTDGRTDGTEIIGPSGKIPGTNKRHDIFLAKQVKPRGMLLKY